MWVVSIYMCIHLNGCFVQHQNDPIHCKGSRNKSNNNFALYAEMLGISMNIMCMCLYNVYVCACMCVGVSECIYVVKCNQRHRSIAAMTVICSNFICFSLYFRVFFHHQFFLLLSLPTSHPHHFLLSVTPFSSIIQALIQYSWIEFIERSEREKKLTTPNTKKWFFSFFFLLAHSRQTIIIYLCMEYKLI